MNPHKQFTERLPHPPTLSIFTILLFYSFSLLLSVLALSDRLGGGPALALRVLTGTSGGRCLLLRSPPSVDIAARQPWRLSFPERLEAACPLEGGVIPTSQDVYKRQVWS